MNVSANVDGSKRTISASVMVEAAVLNPNIRSRNING